MAAEDADAILRARAVALAQPAGELARQDGDALVVFSVGDVRAGVPVARVRTVLPPGPVLRLPIDAGAVVGLRPGRGDVVPVVVLDDDLGATSTVAHGRRHVVVLDGAEPLGILVDTVLGLRASDAGLADATPLAAVATGIAADQVVVLDADELLTTDRFRTRND